MKAVDPTDEIMAVLDAMMAKCLRVKDGLAKTEDGLAIIADDIASTMPAHAKNMYKRSALLDIASRRHQP